MLYPVARNEDGLLEYNGKTLPLADGEEVNPNLTYKKAYIPSIASQGNKTLLYSLLALGGFLVFKR